MTKPVRNLVLVLGGMRSGKSLWAERQAEKYAARSAKVYLATARAEEEDAELTTRIAKHKARRGQDWQVLEESFDIAGAIESQVAGDAVLLVECLSLWLATLLEQEANVAAETERLLSVLARRSGVTLLVSNEVGMGIVPDNALARKFVDEAGQLHTRLAESAERVVWVVAGLSHELKAQELKAQELKAQELKKG